MSLRIVLCSDLGIPGVDPLELKIAYALWEAERANLTISPQLMSTLCLLVRIPSWSDAHRVKLNNNYCIFA